MNNYKSFWSKVEKTETCWNWLAGKDKDGYGQFCFNHKGVRAHRFAYQITKGDIPKGLTIDHLCRNTSCVNPDHLEAVTIKINTLRGFSKSAINAQKTHCHRGHSLTGDNLYFRCGSRMCRICLGINAKKWYNENKDHFKNYYKKNKETFLENQRKYRAKKKTLMEIDF